MLDASISIENDEKFGLIRSIVIQSAEQFIIGVNNALFSVIVFARHAWIYFPIPRYTNKADLINAINEISYNDISKVNHTGTNTPEALDLLRNAAEDDRLGLRSNANYTHVVFITDGRANTRSLEQERLGRKLTGQEIEEYAQQDDRNTRIAASRLRNSGIYDDIFAVGIRGSHNINFDELDYIASRPDFVFETTNFTASAFQVVIRQLAEKICDGKAIL